MLGVTGHRQLKDRVAVAGALESILMGLASDSSATADIGFPPVLLSPLAEGTDRLAARAVLEVPGGVLKAVLPLPPADYEADFPTEESRREFRDLLARAAGVEVLPAQPTRAAAYEAAGRRVVDLCDVLLAVWDGGASAGRGGTAATVAYARRVGRPLIIIDSNDPAKVTREDVPGREGD
jgi:hypothetical protein